MSKVIESEKVVTVDIDDTLLMWDLSKYPDLPRITLNCYGFEQVVVPNQKNINVVKKLAKMGYTIILWSQTGYKWAQTAGIATGLDEFVTLYMSKPRYYVDDLNSGFWLDKRIWRDPVSGKDEYYDEKDDKA